MGARKKHILTAFSLLCFGLTLSCNMPIQTENCYNEAEITKEALFMDRFTKKLLRLEKKGILDDNQSFALWNIKSMLENYILETKKSITTWAFDAPGLVMNDTFSGLASDSGAVLSEQVASLDKVMYSFNSFYVSLGEKQRESLYSDIRELISTVICMPIEHFPMMTPLGLDIKNNGIITAVLKNSLAEKAGILRSDRVLSINKIALDGEISASRVAEMAGKSVTIVMLRNGKEKRVEIKRKLMGN